MCFHLGILNRYLKNLIFHFTKIFPAKINYDIIFIFPTYHTGGSEQVHANITNAFKNYNNLVIFSAPSENTQYLEEFKKNCKVIDLSKIKFGLFRNFIFYRIANGIEHNTLLFGLIYPFYNDLVYKMRNKGLTFFDIIHADESLQFLETKINTIINKRIVINRQTYNSLIDIYNNSNQSNLKERLKLIYNMVEVPNVLPEKSFYSDVLNIIFVGRGTYEKRVEYIIKIARELPQHNFNLIGQIDCQLYSNIPLNCNFIGTIMHKHLLNNYYLTSHIILISSIREGYPLVVMEAMSYGVVPICTNIGGIGFEITNGRNGFLITDNQEDSIIKSFVSTIKQLDLNRDRLKGISSNCYNYAKNNYSKNRFVTEYNNLLKPC